MDATMFDPKQQKKVSDFHRIAAPRIDHVLDELRKLGNCSDRSRYAFTDAERDKVFKTIRAAVDQAEAKFARPPKDQEPFAF